MFISCANSLTFVDGEVPFLPGHYLDLALFLLCLFGYWVLGVLFSGNIYDIVYVLNFLHICHLSSLRECEGEST